MSSAPARTRRKPAPFSTRHWREWTKKLVLDTGDPWEAEEFQEELAALVFEGIEEILFVVPEENTKTTLTANLCLYHISHVREAKALAAASSRSQARESLYGQAEGLVSRSPDLEPFYVCQEGFIRIKYPSLRSRLQITAADAGTGDGIIPTFVALDELHRHKNLDLYRTWRGKLGKRGAQMVTISTAGEPGGDFEALRSEFRRNATEVDVGETRGLYRSGTKFVLLEWCVADDGDPHDLELVERANPFSGITVESLRGKHDAPSFNLGHWRRLVCNQPTRSESSAIDESEWVGMEVDDSHLPPGGEPVWAGLDVAFKYDETGLVSLYAPNETTRILTAEALLIPPRRTNEQLDPEEIKEALLELDERNPIEVLVMDVSDARDIASWAEKNLKHLRKPDADGEGGGLVDRQQTNKFAVDDYQRFMEGMRNGWILIPDNEFREDFKRHALNAVARLLPGGDTRFDRPAKQAKSFQQERRVIDLLSAGSMVHSVWAAELEEDVSDDPLPMVASV